MSTYYTENNELENIVENEYYDEELPEYIGWDLESITKEFPVHQVEPLRIDAEYSKYIKTWVSEGLIVFVFGKDRTCDKAGLIRKEG